MYMKLTVPSFSFSAWISVLSENVKPIILNLAFKLNEYTNASLCLYVGDSNSLSMLF